MTGNTLEERKRYINEIKASFQNPHQSVRYSDVTDSPPIEGSFINAWKVRALLAILLFGLFVYCDQNQTKIQGYTTKDIYKFVEESISIEKVLQTLENVIE